MNKIAIQNSHKIISTQSHLDYYIRGQYERKNKLPLGFCMLLGTFVAIHLEIKQFGRLVLYTLRFHYRCDIEASSVGLLS